MEGESSKRGIFDIDNINVIIQKQVELIICQKRLTTLH